MWFSRMPEHVLYGIITFLGLALITLAAVWVRAHDNHRQWAVERINEHERILAVLGETNRNIERGMSEIKNKLDRHIEVQETFQKDLLQYIKKS